MGVWQIILATNYTLCLGVCPPGGGSKRCICWRLFNTISTDDVIERYSNESADVDNPRKKLKTLFQDKTPLEECMAMS